MANYNAADNNITVTPHIHNFSTKADVVGTADTCSIPPYIPWTVPAGSNIKVAIKSLSAPQGIVENGTCAVPVLATITNNGNEVAETDPLYTHLLFYKDTDPKSSNLSGTSTLELIGSDPSSSVGLAILPSSLVELGPFGKILPKTEVMYGAALSQNTQENELFYLFAGPNANSSSSSGFAIQAVIKKNNAESSNFINSEDLHFNSTAIKPEASDSKTSPDTIKLTDNDLSGGQNTSVSVPSLYTNSVNGTLINYTYDYSDYSANNEYIYAALPVGFSKAASIELDPTAYQEGIVPMPNDADGTLSDNSYLLDLFPSFYGYQADNVANIPSLADNIFGFSKNLKGNTSSLSATLFDSLGNYVQFSIADTEADDLWGKSSSPSSNTSYFKETVSNKYATPVWVTSTDNNPAGTSSTDQGDRTGIPNSSSSLGVFMPTNTTDTFITTSLAAAGTYNNYAGGTLSGGTTSGVGQYIDNYRIIFGNLEATPLAINALSLFPANNYNLGFDTNSILNPAISSAATATPYDTLNRLNLYEFQDSYDACLGWYVDFDKESTIAAGTGKPATYRASLLANSVNGMPFSVWTSYTGTSDFTSNYELESGEYHYGDIYVYGDGLRGIYDGGTDIFNGYLNYSDNYSS